MCYNQHIWLSHTSTAHDQTENVAIGNREENMNKENIPPKKKRRLSLSLKVRFKPVSEAKLEEMRKPFVPKNTEQSSKQ